MYYLKRFLALCLLFYLLLSLSACGEKKAPAVSSDPSSRPESAEPAPPGSSGPSKPVTEDALNTIPLRAAALKGPTAMGLVQLIDRFGIVETPQDEPLTQERSENGGSYVFTLAGAADQISPLLIKGELDIACVPANLAATLYHKTGGQIVTLGINTLGVIYIVEKGEQVHSIADLKGKTIVAAGKGQTPEYGLRYLLEQNDMDPDEDVNIEWKSEHTECVAALAAGTASIAMIPQPFVTVAQNKIDGLRTALDLTAEWDALDNRSAMITGVVVARREIAENHPEVVDAFLADYAASVAWVNANTANAASLIGKYGIVEAVVAEKALPYCNIVCITGEEMKEKLSGYLSALAQQAPEAVGGQLPGDDFYYGT